MRRRWVGLGLGLALVGAGCGDDGGAGPVAGGVDLTEIGTFDVPSALAARPGTDELWVAERAGRVVVVDGDERLDIGGDIGPIDGERGLLGIAFDADGGHLYLGFTEEVGDVRLDRWAVAADGTVDEGSRETLVDVEHRDYANHNGGNVVRAVDGTLWFGVGDGGSADDPQGNAQDPDSGLGKLYRVDPDTGTATVAALGLRNPWRFSFDRESGDLWLGDVGQDQWEEVDHVPFADLDGANFGWDRFEGSHDFEGREVLDDPVVPLHEYGHDRGCSVTGGYRYRGDAVPALEGDYVYGDFCEGEVRVLRLDADGAVTADELLGLPVASLVSFAEDLDGELYVLSLDGSVYRLTAA